MATIENYLAPSLSKPMQVFTCRTSTEISQSQLELTNLEHTSWIQFGQETILIAKESDLNQLNRRAARTGIALERNLLATERENLYVVVQKGRLFQQEHPQVRVLVDRGRFLLVELNADLVAACDKGDQPCYGIRPITDKMVVFQEPAITTARSTPQIQIQNLVEQVSCSSLEANLTKLVSLPNRYSTNSFYLEAANWAKEQLAAMGYETKLETITVNGSISQNMIADKPGNHGEDKDLILVIAHLDSINIADSPNGDAPGADDNGSGSAGLLEIARVFQTYPNNHDLRFILVGGEEQGLFGSRQYLASLQAAEKERIKAVLNMDMIGTRNTPTPTVLLEGAPLSQSIIDALTEAASTYTELKVQTSLEPFASDHVPFIEMEIPAVLTIEGADSANSNIHTANDTIDKLDYDLMLSILRMNVAGIANLISQ